ncbi:MAG: hypothetical protein K9J82_10640, partial [Methylotenera sp.]|nr:hypothetical protein [Methylotenera sp.]
MPLRTPAVRWSGLFAVVVLPAALAACLTFAPAAAQASDLTGLQTLLTEQRYASARPELEALLRKPAPDAADRALIYGWLFARDDGAAIDRRTRDVLQDERAEAVDLLAAGRLALDLRDFDRALACFERALARATQPAE